MWRKPFGKCSSTPAVSPTDGNPHCNQASSVKVRQDPEIPDLKVLKLV